MVNFKILVIFTHNIKMSHKKSRNQGKKIMWREGEGKGEKACASKREV